MIDHSSQTTDTDSKTLLALMRFNGCSYLASRRSLVTPAGDEIRLRAKTCKVFELLALKVNEVVTRDDLASHVWGGVIVSDDSLNQCVREIRKALNDTDRKILETLPRQGYVLHGVQKPVADNTGQAPISAEDQHSPWLFPMAIAAALLLLAAGYFISKSPEVELSSPTSSRTEANNLPTGEDSGDPDNDNLTVQVNTVDEQTSDVAIRLTTAVVTELSRYSNIQPKRSDAGIADYKLELSYLTDDASSLNLQLFHQGNLVLAENLITSDSITTTAQRIAALTGSPAGGAIGHHLMQFSRSKPVEKLTRPECLAHGYGCTSCSGEFDSITPRAVQCLSRLLENNPDDQDAWALQSTVYSRQYLWGSSLQEPMRSDKSKRRFLRSKAVEAATRADALAGGDNPSVYWGTVQAHLASCDAEKMQIAVDRGLKLNPGDPNMLAVYGNFLSYAGKWNEGKALVEKALEQEPRFFKKWWYMAPAKWHYRRGEYQQAYDLFLKSFNERNWLSYLQMAYTLPHLGRIEEAKKALLGFMRVAPSMTREHVYEFYQSYCFDDNFLNRVKTAFDLIDMPSRGSGDDFSNIQPIRATVEKIGDRMVEYIDVGSGTPLVFVHGSISDYRTWGYMVLPVSERYRYLSYSLRYFGTLDWPDGDLQFDENVDVDDLIDFIEHKKLGPVYLVGWSRSGSIISVAAHKRPDLVKGLIHFEPVLYELLNPDTNPNPPSEDDAPDFTKIEELIQQNHLDSAVQIFFERALERQPGEFATEPTMLQRVVLDNARTLPLNFGEHAPDQPVVDCEYISQIQTPGLVLYGENTNLPWQYMSTRYAECLPNGQAIAIANANHDGPLSQPQQLSDLMEVFISGIEFPGRTKFNK